jgi:hypothetical protein
MSDDIKYYDPEDDGHGWVEMREDEGGDWVRREDYEALKAKYEASRPKIHVFGESTIEGDIVSSELPDLIDHREFTIEGVGN